MSRFVNLKEKCKIGIFSNLMMLDAERIDLFLKIAFGQSKGEIK